jgi:hypothetical protein
MSYGSPRYCIRTCITRYFHEATRGHPGSCKRLRPSCSHSQRVPGQVGEADHKAQLLLRRYLPLQSPWPYGERALESRTFTHTFLIPPHTTKRASRTNSDIRHIGISGFASTRGSTFTTNAVARYSVAGSHRLVWEAVRALRIQGSRDQLGSHIRAHICQQFWV